MAPGQQLKIAGIINILSSYLQGARPQSEASWSYPNQRRHGRSSLNESSVFKKAECALFHENGDIFIDARCAYTCFPKEIQRTTINLCIKNDE